MNKLKSNMPNNADDIYETLRSGQSLYFVVPKKHAGAFKRQTKRINRADNLIRKKSGIFNSVKANLYFFYTAIRGYFASFRNKETEMALLVYQTSWMHISSIDGKETPEGLWEIIFHGKVSKS